MSTKEGSVCLYPTKDEIKEYIASSIASARKSQKFSELVTYHPELLKATNDLIENNIFNEIVGEKFYDIKTGIPCWPIQIVEDYVGAIRYRLDSKLKKRFSFFILFPEVQFNDLKERRFEEMFNRAIKRHPLFQNGNWFRSEAVVRAELNYAKKDDDDEDNESGRPAYISISVRFLHEVDSRKDTGAYCDLSAENKLDMTEDTVAVGVHFSSDIGSKGEMVSSEATMYIEPRKRLDWIIDKVKELEFDYRTACNAFWTKQNFQTVLREHATLYSNIYLGKDELPWEEKEEKK